MPGVTTGSPEKDAAVEGLFGGVTFDPQNSLGLDVPGTAADFEEGLKDIFGDDLQDRVDKDGTRQVLA